MYDINDFQNDILEALYNEYEEAAKRQKKPDSPPSSYMRGIDKCIDLVIKVGREVPDEKTDKRLNIIISASLGVIFGLLVFFLIKVL